MAIVKDEQAITKQYASIYRFLFFFHLFSDEEDSAVAGVDRRGLLPCHDFTVPHA